MFNENRISPTIAMLGLHVVAHAAFDGHVRYQTMHVFGVDARAVAGVGIAVRVAAFAVKQIEKFVAVLDHGCSPLCLWSCACRVFLRAAHSGQLLVIAQREQALAFEVQRARQAVTETPHHFADLLLVPEGQAAVELAQMVARIAHQAPQCEPRRGAGGRIETLHDSGADIAERCVLQSCQYGQQTPAVIGRIGMFRVEIGFHVLISC
jgi:hypothetical protein